MKSRHLFSIWVAFAMLAAFASNATDQPADAPNDQVVASFERELGHKAPQPKVVERKSIDDDELYERVNKTLQTPDKQPQADEGE